MGGDNNRTDIFSRTWDLINERKSEQGHLDTSDKTLNEEFTANITALATEIEKLRDDEVRQKFVNVAAELAVMQFKVSITLDQFIEFRKLFDRRNVKNKRAKLKGMMKTVELLLKGM